MRVGLDEQVLQLQRDLESAKSDLATTRATAAKAAAGGGTAAAVGARAAGGAAANGVDSARLVELEGLLSARTNELQETNARCVLLAANSHPFKLCSPRHCTCCPGQFQAVSL